MKREIINFNPDANKASLSESQSLEQEKVELIKFLVHGVPAESRDRFRELKNKGIIRQNMSQFFVEAFLTELK